MFKIVSLGSSVPLILLVPLAYFLFHWCWHQWGVQHPPTRWPAHHCWQDSVPIKTSLEIMVNLQNVVFILIWMETFFRRASANSCSGTSHCDLNCISFKFRQNIFGLKCLVNIALFTWCLHMDVHCQFLLHFQDVVWVCNDNDIHDHQCHFLFPDHLITLDSRWKKLSLFPPPIAGLKWPNHQAGRYIRNDDPEIIINWHVLFFSNQHDAWTMNIAMHWTPNHQAGRYIRNDEGT